MPTVKICYLPGGKKPQRQTAGAVGFDVYARAIVSPSEKDPQNPADRLTLFNFVDEPEDPSIAGKIHGNRYRLLPRERATVGLGFRTEMAFPLFYWVLPRSGLASKHGITVANAPGTVDPDYRGEAGAVILNNSDGPFDIYKDMRIGQIVFTRAIIPELEVVESYELLSQTDRGSGGFGSTGFK